MTCNICQQVCPAPSTKLRTRRFTFFASPWNVVDGLSQLFVMATAAGQLAGMGERMLAAFSAITTVLLMIKVFGYFRGFPDLANLVMVLVQNAYDMKGEGSTRKQLSRAIF